jgi:hypothetical protein
MISFDFFKTNLGKIIFALPALRTVEGQREFQNYKKENWSARFLLARGNGSLRRDRAHDDFVSRIANGKVSGVPPRRAYSLAALCELGLAIFLVAAFVRLRKSKKVAMTTSKNQ